MSNDSIDIDDALMLSFINTAISRADFFSQYKKSPLHRFKPLWFGVDWSKGSGMNRGEVIKRDNNVTHLRFKTVEINEILK